jgi:hypothetical protein
MDTGMEVVDSWKTAGCGGTNKRVRGYEIERCRLFETRSFAAEITNIFHGHRDTI